tara:strand:+ start:274 stop:540 length:267 start_codon:yes stop_codon:yes gene_type:complete
MSHISNNFIERKKEDMSDRIIIKKNRNESIVVSQTEYKGFDLVDIRTFFMDASDELMPTKKGITVRLEKVDELIAALTKISQKEEETA